MWAFAALEAAAIRLAERLQPGSLDLLEERTAGRVADKLLSLCLKEDSPKAARIAAARRFQALVRSRNNLLHSKPGKLVGKLVDGKVVDANGNVVASGVSTTVQSQASADTALVAGAADEEGAATQVSRTVQFIPGGTGKNGIIPVQNIRME